MPRKGGYNFYPAGKLGKFALMKPINSIALLTTVVAILSFISCRPAAKKPSQLWDTSDAETDRLLALSDYYESPGSPGIDDCEARDSILLLISEKKDVPSAALWAKARYLILNDEEDNAVARSLDSLALTLADAEKSPYLNARIRLDLAYCLKDAEAQSEIYFNLLGYFAEIRDSLRLVRTLYDLQEAYTTVGDDSMQIECLREIKRVTPDSLPVLRDIMDFNILSMTRQIEDPKEYLVTLDSMKLKRSLMDEVPPIGLMVYSDLYRITDNTLYMDTAKSYYEQIEGLQHPVIDIYKIYQLRLFDSLGMQDSARVRSDEMKTMLAEESSFSMEIARELIRHYRHTGETEYFEPLRNRLHADSLAAASMVKAVSMSRIKTHHDREKMMQALHREEKAGRDRTLILSIIIIFAVLAGAAISFHLYRRKYHRQKARLEDALDNADRKMVAAHLISASNDTAEKSAALGGFDIAFSRVRPGFTEELLQVHPKLTAYELRLCCLLSIGLDTKEIARILSINPDSVKKSRQRLRAKLNMPSGMTFMEYFRNLPQ